MTQTNNSTSQPQQDSLGKRMVIGAGIGFIVILLFLLSAGEGNPEWGKLWMVKPLMITSLAGATGGLCNYFILNFHPLAGVSKTVAVILSVIVFIIGLWLGVVLGLDGTLWN